jgi:hypothetical protein
MTGDLADNHDILGFKVAETSPMTPQEAADVRRRIQEVSMLFIQVHYSSSCVVYSVDSCFSYS